VQRRHVQIVNLAWNSPSCSGHRVKYVMGAELGCLSGRHRHRAMIRRRELHCTRTSKRSVQITAQPKCFGRKREIPNTDTPTARQTTRYSGDTDVADLPSTLMQRTTHVLVDRFHLQYITDKDSRGAQRMSTEPTTARSIQGAESARRISP
jgi:hypothetical protein